MATKLLYRINEAVEMTGISRSTLYELLRAGEIESVSVGRARLIPHDALEAYVARLRERADGAGTEPAA